MNRPRTARSFRPRIEAMEDRSVPAVITVTTTQDDFTPNNGLLSLREAIAAANADSATYPPNAVADNDVTANSTGTFGADTIQFAQGVTGTIPLATLGELQITDALAIHGPGSALLAVSGQNLVRVFDIAASAGQVSIAGLTVSDGFVMGEGGGIANAASLSLSDVILESNKATAPPGFGTGGGVYSSGNLVISSSIIRNNQAEAGGAIANTGTAEIDDSTIDSNVGNAFAGGLYNLATMTVRRSAVTNNHGGTGGGGVFNDNNATLTILDSTVIMGNIAQDGGGGGILNVDGMVVVQGSLLEANEAQILSTGSGTGGGIDSSGPNATLEIASSILRSNMAERSGGAISVDSKLVVADSTFEGNMAAGSGPGSLGGAIYSLAGSGSIDGSTFLGNSAEGSGGSVYHDIDFGASPLSFTNSTFYGNIATVAGGALALVDSATPAAGIVNLTHVTITQNSAQQGGGIAVFTVGSGPTVNLLNTIVAGNNAPNGPEIFGQIASNGNNLFGSTVGATGFAPSDKINIASPGLGTLADNGGPTQTVALLPGSPALGGGNPSAGLTTDQRGLPRPPGGPTDIGAFQAQAPTGNPDSFSTPFGQILSIPAPGVLSNDLSNDPAYSSLTATLLSSPPSGEGSVTLNADGSFTFTSANGFSGDTTFTYAVSNGPRASAPVTVTITVGPAPPPPPPPPATHLFAVGAGAGGAPVVRVFNEDETQRFAFFAFDPAFDGGVRVAVGDVNGDLVDDVVAAVGPGGGPHVKVFDGVTGAEIASFFAYAADFSLGVHVAVGDVNNDGYADIIAGAGSGGGPNVKVFSGRDQSELASFFAYDPGFRGGARVGAGDVNGFPGAEIITIAGPSGGPDVRVFDQTGEILDQFFAFDPSYRAGGFVSVLDGRIAVAPDSFPDFEGSLLADQFATFPGSRGVVGGGKASADVLTRQPQVLTFDFPVAGENEAATPVQVLPVLDPGFLGGVRIAAGRYKGVTGIFATAGPGGGSRIQFFPLGEDGLLSPVPTLDDVALPDPGFAGSVYVGAGGE